MMKTRQYIINLCLAATAIIPLSSCSDNVSVAPNLPDKSVLAVLNDTDTDWSHWRSEVEDKMEGYTKLKDDNTQLVYTDSKHTCYIQYTFSNGSYLTSSIVAIPRQNDISIEGVKKLSYLGNLDSCDVFGDSSSSSNYTMGVIYQPATNKNYTIVSFTSADESFKLTRSDAAAETLTEDNLPK